MTSAGVWSRKVCVVIVLAMVQLLVAIEGAVLVELQVDHPTLGANVTYIAQEASFGPMLAAAGVKGFF